MIRSIKNNILNRLSPELKESLRALTKKIPFLRSVLLRHNSKPAEVYLISFPKTGRTWLSLMIGKAVELHFRLNNANVLNLEDLAKTKSGIPKIVLIHDDSPHWKKPHELERIKNFYKNNKVIFLVRDPRDVIVSLYFEKKKRLISYIEKERKAYSGSFEDERIRPYKYDLKSYLSEEEGSFATLLEYYNIWEKNRHIPNDFLIVRYEDIHENPHREVRKALDFLDLGEVSDETINEAVIFASFKNMKKMDQENKCDSHRLSPATVTDHESFKTRLGKIGGFTDYLTPDEIEYLNEKMNATLSGLFGYSTAD